MSSPNKKAQFQARLENQKNQLERHGNFAEVVIRTTPEATDMINFARLWEYVLTQADRQTRGYIAKSSREEFDQTRADFNEAVAFMIGKMKESVERHDLDLSGSNFISRVAQRYGISERKRKAPQVDAPAKAEKAESKAPVAEQVVEAPAKPAPAKAAVAADDLEEL